MSENKKEKKKENDKYKISNDVKAILGLLQAISKVYVETVRLSTDIERKTRLDIYNSKVAEDLIKMYSEVCFNFLF